MRGIVLAVVAALGLAGCSDTGGIGSEGSPMWMRTAPQEAKLAYFQRACTAYGFQVGTAQMAECMQREAQSAESRATQTFANVARQNAVPQPRMTSTTCTQQGVFTNCTTW